MDSSRSGCHTVNVRPCADQEMMWSLLGSLTRFHVFLRARGGGNERGDVRLGSAARGGSRTGGIFRTSARRGTFSVGPGAAGAAKPRPRRSRVVVRRWRARARSLGDTSGRDGTRGWRGGRPRRRPAAAPPLEIHVSGKKKPGTGGLATAAPPRSGTHHRNGETFTVANGVEAPVALPGWALAPLAEVMCRESDLLSAVCLEVTTGVTRWKTKGLEPQKKT